MTVRIKNTAEDRSKSTLHRTASKFELEPQLGDQRIRLRSYLDITDEHYERVKHLIGPWVTAGMVEVIALDGATVSVDPGPVTPPEIIAPALTPAPIEVPPLPEPAKLDVSDELPVEDVLTTNEPAGATVAEEAAPIEDKPASDTPKKGPGKKKLF